MFHYIPLKATFVMVQDPPRTSINIDFALGGVGWGANWLGALGFTYNFYRMVFYKVEKNIFTTNFCDFYFKLNNF